MKKLTISLIALLSLVISNVIASEQIYNNKIEHLSSYDTYSVIQLRDPILNTDGCTHTLANKMIAIDYVNKKELFSSILSAYMANREVGFGVSGCYNYGTTTIQKIYRVEVYKN